MKPHAIFWAFLGAGVFTVLAVFAWKIFNNEANGVRITPDSIVLISRLEQKVNAAEAAAVEAVNQRNQEVTNLVHALALVNDALNAGDREQLRRVQKAADEVVKAIEPEPPVRMRDVFSETRAEIGNLRGRLEAQ